MSFIDLFTSRGYLYQCTDLEALKNEKKIVAYIGFDVTAPSLHVGSLMQIMILRLLQQCGHKPIVLLGDATARIGDPTGKTEIRKTLSEEQVDENIIGIKKSLSKFITFGDRESDAILVRNSTWLNEVKYMEFLIKYGKLISVNKMVNIETVKNRLQNELPLSFLEFNYMLLQGYDFCHLNIHHNCSLQIGGSDQWGNIVTGIEIARKVLQKELYGLTTPLLTTASGVKMGKSVGGAIWLNEDMLSPYEYYQYWRNVDDKDVIRFAKLYSEWNDEELEDFENISDINEAKKKLAHRLTSLCHGKDNAQKAHETSIQVFEKYSSDADLPTVTIIEKNLKAYELLYEAQLVPSKSEGRKLIRGGGAKINDKVIDDENMLINLNNQIKLSIGKKKHIIVKSK